MTEDEPRQWEEGGPGEDGGGRRERNREGFSAWMGVLSAFKEAIEETIVDLRDRGDIAPERAREALRSAMRRAQDAMGGARERLDFVPRKEFDALRAEVEELRRRVADLEAGGGRRVSVEGE